MSICSNIGRVLAIAIIISVGIISSPAFGQIVDSYGFENPSFTLGDLSGQNDWLTTGNGSSNAVVQSDIVSTGSQAVRVDRAASSNDRWAQPVIGYRPSQFVVIEWDMNVTQATGHQEFGPYFGAEAYDSDSGIFVLGSLGVDATTGDVLYQAEDTGFLTDTGSDVSFDSWNRFKMRLDYAADEYSAFLNGSFLATTGFVDRSFDLDDFTDADITAIAAAGTVNAQHASGTAYFDNFVVTPESASIVAGDTDGDGDVDFLDFLVISVNFNQTCDSRSCGDFNGDGVVTFVDFLALSANFGAKAVAVSVPEPSACLLAWFMAATLLLWRKGRPARFAWCPLPIPTTRQRRQRQ